MIRNDHKEYLWANKAAHALSCHGYQMQKTEVGFHTFFTLRSKDGTEMSGGVHQDPRVAFIAACHVQLTDIGNKLAHSCPIAFA